MQAALQELLVLGADGIQLTPGNAPTVDFEGFVLEDKTPHLFHHGFSWGAMRRHVWSDTGECLVSNASVHPPQVKDKAYLRWRGKVDRSITYEVMHPGYDLADSESVEWAMSEGLHLAIDYSHIYIQLFHDTLNHRILRKIQNYERVTEVHISDNDGRSDQHRPLTKDSYGLSWARERAKNTPVVYEGYMHRLSASERKEQIDLVKELVYG